MVELNYRVKGRKGWTYYTGLWSQTDTVVKQVNSSHKAEIFLVPKKRVMDDGNLVPDETTKAPVTCAPAATLCTLDCSSCPTTCPPCSTHTSCPVRECPPCTTQEATTASPRPCAGQPCTNGTCSDLATGSYFCTCYAGYKNTACDASMSPSFFILPIGFQA